MRCCTLGLQCQQIRFPLRSGDGTARLWPISESSVSSPVVLHHQFKDVENHKNVAKDVTSIEWNVSVEC